MILTIELLRVPHHSGSDNCLCDIYFGRKMGRAFDLFYLLSRKWIRKKL